MKKTVLAVMLLIVAMTLTACGGRENAAAQKDASAQQASSGAQTAAAIVGNSLPTDGEIPGQTEAQVNPEEATATAESASAPTDKDLPVDLDLTKISGTVVYSQVYDMLTNPDSYMGRIIKMRGSFSYFQDPETKQEYFAAIIADATACCAQGIEFVWAGEHSYPRDYPPPDTEITVTGAFNTYYEGDAMYARLVDARVEWNS